MRLIFILFFAIALKANSQTIINYQTWPGASGCNIFSSATSVPATVNGTAATVTHQSTLAQPIYDAVNHAVELDGGIKDGSTYLGTEYRITYNF